VSISMSAPMTADRSFHILEAVPSRLEASPERPRRRGRPERRHGWSWRRWSRGRMYRLRARRGCRPPSCSADDARPLKRGAMKPREDAKGLGFVEITPAASAAVDIDLGGVVIRAGADIGQELLVRIIRAVRTA